MSCRTYQLARCIPFHDPHCVYLPAPKWSEERDTSARVRHEKEGRNEINDRNRDSRSAAAEIKGLAVRFRHVDHV